MRSPLVSLEMLRRRAAVRRSADERSTARHEEHAIASRSVERRANRRPYAVEARDRVELIRRVFVIRERALTNKRVRRALRLRAEPAPHRSRVERKHLLRGRQRVDAARPRMFEVPNPRAERGGVRGYAPRKHGFIDRHRAIHRLEERALQPVATKRAVDRRGAQVQRARVAEPNNLAEHERRRSLVDKQRDEDRSFARAMREHGIPVDVGRAQPLRKSMFGAARFDVAKIDLRANYRAARRFRHDGEVCLDLRALRGKSSRARSLTGWADAR